MVLRAMLIFGEMVACMMSPPPELHPRAHLASTIVQTVVGLAPAYSTGTGATLGAGLGWL